MATLGITSSDELRQVDHRAVIAWERAMREAEHAAPSTIRRRLAALSSLFKHLVRHDHAAKNPVTEIERPAINRDEGTTLAFSKTDARKLLDLPKTETEAGELIIEGLRDRAILSVGLQVGLRRAEIGTHHHIAGRYLAAYAGEMAWRENNRRVSNGEQFLMIAAASAAHPVSRQWKGYWQRPAHS